MNDNSIFAPIGGSTQAPGRSSDANFFEADASFPPLLTGGEIPKIDTKRHVSTIIDYLTFSFLDLDQAPEGTPAGWHPFADMDLPHRDLSMPMTDQVSDHLADILAACRHSDLSFKPRRSIFLACRKAWDLYASFVNKETGELIGDLHVGTFGLHYSKNAEGKIVARWIGSMTGSQCPSWDMTLMAKALAHRGAKITRADIAVDDFLGQISWETASEMERAGYFVNRRRPWSDDKGTRNPEDGRSLYVGKKDNGKELCIYEKGKQKKSVEFPDWMRWELRLGDKGGRIIPYDVLVDPARFFVGSFPRVFPIVFADLSTSSPEIIKTQQVAKSKNDIDRFIANAARSYGKGLNTLLASGADPAILMDRLKLPGVAPSLQIPDAEAVADKLGKWDKQFIQ